MQYLVINDLKSDDLQRGAALTLEAYLEGFPAGAMRDDGLPDSYTYIRSAEFQPFMVRPEEDILILGNTTQLNPAHAMWIVNKCHYFKINFDYNFCAIRNPMIHNMANKSLVTYPGELGVYLKSSECKCDLQIGNVQAEIIKNAICNFFMSKGQLKEFKKVFPKLEGYVSHSCFDQRSLNFFKNQKKKKTKKALVWNAPDYIKGAKNAIDYCKENNLEYTPVDGIAHDEMLDQMSRHECLIFMPNAWDTAPRLTIEAKMLGCEVITNQNVQHTDEFWWSQSTTNMHNFLSDIPRKFWWMVRSARKIYK